MNAARAERRRAAREGDKFAHRRPFASRRAEREMAEGEAIMARWRAREARIAALEAQAPGWPELRSACKREGVPYDDYASLLEFYVGLIKALGALADAIEAAKARDAEMKGRANG